MPNRSAHRSFPDTLLAAALVTAAVVAMAVGLMSDARGDLIGDYDLTQGTEIPSLQNLATAPGALGDMSVLLAGSATSTFDGTGWSWGNANVTPGAGLSVGVPATFGNYTIGLRFSFGDILNGQFQRLLRFNDIDQGMYVFGTSPGVGQFRFFGGQVLSGGTISNNTTVDFVLTRDGISKQVFGYTIDDSGPTPIATEILDFTDTSDFLVSTGNVLQFFRDQTGGIEFSPSGTTSLIRVWDAPLTAAEIPMAMVPEPATAVLLAAAGSGALLYLHRRRRSLR